MAKTGKFINNSAHAVNILANTTYAVARSHNINALGGNSNIPNRAYMLRTLYIELDSLAGLSAKPTLTVRLTRDAAGDTTIVGDVTASISLGVTDATDGAITVAIDFAYSHNSVTGAIVDNLHCFWKLDQGTGQVRRIELLTEE